MCRLSSGCSVQELPLHRLQSAPLVPIAPIMPRFTRTLTPIVAFVFLAVAARAQFVDAPQTVPRGEWLMETDVVDVALDRSEGIRTRSTALMLVQLTTGVTENLDVQFGLETWLENRAKGPGLDERVSGMGEAFVRVKWNFWKNDRVAIALLPYYKFRQTAAASVRPAVSQYGLLVPYSLTLSDAWQCYSQVEFDWLDNGTGGRDCTWSGFVAFQRSINKEWSWYWETTSSAVDGKGAWATQAGAGVVWQVNEKFAWDAAIYVGVTEAAPDWYTALRFVWSF